MLKSKKGLYGYFKAEKKRRLLITILLFAIPLVIFVSGMLYSGTKDNILTIVAMVGLIPACLSFVGLVMIMMRKSIPEEEFQEIDPHIGTLTFAYELYMTDEKQNSMIDCLVICGNEVVGLVTDPKTDIHFAQDHLQRYLKADGWNKVSVHLLGDQKKFIERMDSMNAHEKELRAGIPFTPREAYPGLDREDLIRLTALNISL